MKQVFYGAKKNFFPKKKKKISKKSRAEVFFAGQKKKKNFFAGNCLKQILGQKSEVFNFLVKWPPAAILDIGMRPKTNSAEILP